MAVFLQRFIKYNLLLLFGALATLVLFYTMQRLILTDFEAQAVEKSVRIADITAPELVIEVVRVQPKPEPLVEPPLAPPSEPPPLVAVGPGQNPTFTKPAFDAVGGPGDYLGFSDTSAVALIQVQPVYPQRALLQDVEGYVIVEFDVDEAGIVVNPRVLYAEPEGYFESSALKALERYRYKPKVVDGKEVKMFGVQQKLSFTLE